MKTNQYYNQCNVPFENYFLCDVSKTGQGSAPTCLKCCKSQYDCRIDPYAYDKNKYLVIVLTYFSNTLFEVVFSYY